jgi:hypothetical protein
MMANSYEESKCLESKRVLTVCSTAAFLEVNTAGAGNIGVEELCSKNHLLDLDLQILLLMCRK